MKTIHYCNAYYNLKRNENKQMHWVKYIWEDAMNIVIRIPTLVQRASTV